MIKSVLEYEELLTTHFELDDLQGVDIALAAAVSHKVSWSEMLWLRIIGASGSGKTELLRSLLFEPYSVPMGTLTAGALTRGFVPKTKEGKVKAQQTLLQRLNGKMVITQEFASILTKDKETQKYLFGLFRSVYDGSLDADFGSEQGYLHQESHFDWIIGSTSYIDKVRQMEYLLGSRFIDLHWRSPENRERAVGKAMYNDGTLNTIRVKLLKAMANIIDKSRVVPKVRLDYIPKLADITASLRSPVERDARSREIDELPEIELGTRMGQGLARIARGLKMLGVEEENIKPYLIRLVFDSMPRIRAAVIKAWLDGVTKQTEIAARLDVSQGAVSRVIEDIKVLKFEDEWLGILNGGR